MFTKLPDWLPFHRRSKVAKIRTFFSQHSFSMYLFVVTVVVTLVMTRSFTIHGDSMLVGSHNVGDFSAHIPLIRSFSTFSNSSFEYPLFPSEPLKYHFFFYLLVAVLEILGVRIDLALNMLSVLSLVGVSAAIYFFAKYLTNGSKLAGWLAGIFFLFNSSFSWWYYLFAEERSPSLLKLLQRQSFGSSGPYDGNMISVYWSLNTFINQRHFAFALLLCFAVWYLVATKKYRYWRAMSIGMIFILSWSHIAVLYLCLLLLGGMLVFLPERKKMLPVIVGAVLAILPSWIFFHQASVFYPAINSAEYAWKPGFIADRHSVLIDGQELGPWLKWSWYWIMNWGVLPLFGVIGSVILLKDRTIPQLQKRWIIMLGGLSVGLFGLANLFQLGIDLPQNHKLLNFTQMSLSVLAGAGIAVLLRQRPRRWLVAPFIILSLTLGGILDVIPVVNALQYHWQEVDVHPVSRWVLAETTAQDRIFNMTFSTNQVSITGRQIWYGWPTYPWSLGYNVDARKREILPIVVGEKPIDQVCQYFTTHRLHYIIAHPNEKQFLEEEINFAYFDEHFPKEQVADFVIYRTIPTCYQ